MTNHQVEPVDPQLLAPWLQGRSFQDWRAEYDKQGYLIFREALSAKGVERIRAALEPHFIHFGRNDFEGFRTNRVYSLLSKSPEVFSDLITHPLALAFAEADLGNSCLLSSALAVNLNPGETVQNWHQDDGYIQVPLPHPPYGLSAFWAIDDMTEENGATEIIPGSHLWTESDRIVIPALTAQATDPALVRSHHPDSGEDPLPREDAMKVVIPAGSLMIIKGTLCHRGGANNSDASRLIVTTQYCAPWARQLENVMAEVPRKVAATLSKRMRQLLGYSVYGAFMGFVDGTHPDRLLNLEH